jgi:hypothetical protein
MLLNRKAVAEWMDYELALCREISNCQTEDWGTKSLFFFFFFLEKGKQVVRSVSRVN